MGKGFWLAIFLVAMGVALWTYSLRWPYYTDPQGPFQLSERFDQSATPDGGHSVNWFSELRKLETPRKVFADWGMGLAALGVGVFGIFGGQPLFRKREQKGRRVLFFGLWIASWLVLLPGSFLYYLIRFVRFEYPVNGDSIMIPIFQTSVIAVAGCMITTLVLVLLLWGRDMPDRWRFAKPATMSGWMRSAFVSLWIIAWLVGLGPSIPDGDVGLILMLTWTGSLLLLLLAAPKRAAVA